MDRHEQRRRTRRAPRGLLALGCGLAMALAACASDGPAEPRAAAEREARPVSAPPPPGSEFARIEVGMDDEEVRELLGRPARQTAYHTFKAWVPFYQGGDDRRYQWRYPGKGRVTFNQNRYSGDLQVIRVEYDPDQPY